MKTNLCRVNNQPLIGYQRFPSNLRCVPKHHFSCILYWYTWRMYAAFTRNVIHTKIQCKRHCQVPPVVFFKSKEGTHDSLFNDTLRVSWTNRTTTQAVFFLLRGLYCRAIGCISQICARHYGIAHKTNCGVIIPRYLKFSEAIQIGDFYLLLEMFRIIRLLLCLIYKYHLKQASVLRPIYQTY